MVWGSGQSVTAFLGRFKLSGEQHTPPSVINVLLQPLRANVSPWLAARNAYEPRGLQVWCWVSAGA